MKKYQILAATMACAATFAIFAASDRMDVYNRAGQFSSHMVEDIKHLKLGKAAGEEGYSTLIVTTPTGTTEHKIDDLSEIQYTALDENLAHEITTVDAPNAKVRLLDWRNNTDVWGEAQIDPTKPADWRGCWYDGIPHYQVDTDKGFASEIVITGKYTGKVYTDTPGFVWWSTSSSNLLGANCYAFSMPFEPVEIKAISEEKTTYEGAPILGTFTGYQLTTKANRIAAPAEATLEMEIKANGTYVLTTTDSNEYDILDDYSWDEQKNTFAYIPYEGELRNEIDVDAPYGITGKFNGNDILYGTIHNIVVDKYENTVRYFIVRGEADVNIASMDDDNRNILVEYIPAEGEARYFIYEAIVDYPQEVTMTFQSGKNIGEACAAMCYQNGENLFKYEYSGSGEPKFINRGKEAGTYKGEGEDLVLDGYGLCTLGDAEGTYTIEGGVANVVINDNSTIYVVDFSAKTYAEMTSDEWDGEESYSLNEATGKYGNQEEAAIHTMSVAFDQDLRGNSMPGYAAIKTDFVSTGGLRTTGGIADICKYIYNEKAGTVTVTNVLAGTSASTSGKRNLTFVVSADKQSMYLDDSKEDRIYGIGRDGSYWLTGEVNTLLAPEKEPELEPAAVDLFDNYSGSALLKPQGMSLEMSCNVEITIDAEAEKASFKVSDGNLNYIDMPEAEYLMTGYTLYIKDVPVFEIAKEGTGYVPTTKDFEFTVSEDATTLTSTEFFTYYSTYMTVDIDFNGKEFKYKAPVVAPEPGDETVTLADSYTGTTAFDYMGEQTATFTVTFDKEAAKATIFVTSALGTGELYNNVKVDYTLVENVLTLSIPSYENYSSPTNVDVTFTVSADGKTITGDEGTTTCLTSIFGQYKVYWSKSSLTAEGADDEIELADSYTGTVNISLYGQSKPCNVTLTITDASANKASLSVYSTDLKSDLYKDVELSYSLDGNTLTLLAVPNDLAFNTPGEAKNLEFTLSEDFQSMTGTEDQTTSITVTTMFSTFDVLWSSAELTAAE